MNLHRAVIFLEDDSQDMEQAKPLLLETVLFCPILTWMCEKLKADGVKRFFIFSSPEYSEDIHSCFRPEDDAIVSSDHEALNAFLAEDGPVAVFPCPELPLDHGDNCAYRADAGALRRSWSPAGQSEGAVAGAEPLKGWTAIYDLPRLQPLELLCRDAVAERHLKNGVRILDPSAVYIDPRVDIGPGTVVLPGTILRGQTSIGRDCVIGPNAMIRDCIVGEDTEINASQTNESVIGSHTHVGPFAYVRPGSRIGDHVKVGDFVEIKNSVIGDGTKISHLTYVGDSDVGREVNFGCGTVTTNYDGFQKHRCTIGDRAFIGCNTNLVAPVSVGQDSYIAAGATITKDVPEDALAVARARQENKSGWAARRRRMQRGKTEDSGTT